MFADLRNKRVLITGSTMGIGLAAAQAFAAYSGTSPETRARFLETIADELDGLGESFFAIAHAETALPLARLQGERARTSGQLRMFAGLLRRGGSGRGGDFRGGNGHGHRLGDGDGLMDLNGGCAVAVDDSDPVFAFGDFEFGNAAFAHEVDQCLEFAQIHDGLGLVI